MKQKANRLSFDNYIRPTLLRVALFSLSLLLLSAIGCDNPTVYKIGVSQCSADDWRTKMNDEINRETMLHDDVVVEIRSADDSNARQIEDIQYFVDNKFDILIVSPNEAAELTPVIRKVYDQGMPVIIFDRDILDDSYTAHIGVDNKGLGRSAAHYATHILGPGAKAIEIFGRPGSTPAEERHIGFVDEFTAEGGEVIASEPANWNKEDAVPVVDSLLGIYDDVDLIYAHNDRMAIGASEVAARRGRDNIQIIGIDAAPAIGIKAVADSVIDATFLYPTDGHRLIRTALAILKGEPYEREQILPISSAVDLTNADILLLQNEALKDETGKMQRLKLQVDDYWRRLSSQTSLLYASIVIIILMFGVVFLTLRAFWQHKRHKNDLLVQNHKLEEERDKQKQLNEKLEEATRSKLMFFTNVSHDLRTPLTLISEPVAQLSAADNLTPQQKIFVRIADKNVRILQRLINQILDLRKCENGKLDVNLSEIDLAGAISEWIESFSSAARKRHLKLSVDTGANASATIAVDIEKFERVFFNLLSNAIKYTPNHGEIKVYYNVEDGNAVLRVADNAQGISEGELGNIFDRFYQVDRIHPNGSGIGLSLCKAFVELHGGTITVRSTLKKGSEFTVMIPVRHVGDTAVEAKPLITEAAVAAELDEIEAPRSFDDDKPLVLVVDDNRDIQRLLSELLSSRYNIITASNGSEGFKKAVKYVPDLVICDMMMPVMDGLECCRRLKNEISTSHIPVLMLTACSMDEQRIQGYDSGADGYLAKPFNDEVLQSRCQSLIANRKRIKELWQARRPIDRSKEKPRQSTSDRVVDVDNDFYNCFLDIFNSEMSNSEMNVDSIASRLGLDRSQFYRKIKALTNYSPVELIRHLRLDRGRLLLTTTDKTISEIAYEIGFSSPAYFSKCYKDEYGNTPSDLRAELRK